jgi:hypothetical protein
LPVSPRRSAAIATLESKLSPTRAGERFGVAADNGFEVTAEVPVKACDRATLLGQSNGLGE